jgi:hypothetical protein
MKDLKDIVDSEDAELIQTKTSDFMQVVGPLTAAKYKAENPEPETTSETTDDKNVVDAEATEVKSA